MNLPLFSIRNKIAVNFFMWFIILGGVYYWFNLTREFFPYVEPDSAIIRVEYPSTTPEEVEKNVTKKIENAIKGVQKIDEIESKIVEGLSLTLVTFEKGSDSQVVLNKIKSEVDKIKDELPKDTKEPVIKLSNAYVPVITVMIFGDVSMDKVHREGKAVRDDLLDLAGISNIILTGVLDREFWVEVRTEKLEEFNLTFAEIGKIIQQSNINVPGGQLGSELGNIQIRTQGESQQIEEIENIIIRSYEDGTIVRLKDVGKIRKTYENKVEEAFYKGKRAVMLNIYQSPGEDTIQIAKLVNEYVERNQYRMGGAIEVEALLDNSTVITSRLDVLLENSISGFILVILSLIVFMDFKVAFWTATGMVVSFLGTFIIMSFLGVSINMVSLLGLIMVLGMVVDDAVVVGENVFTKVRNGLPQDQAAVQGTNEVAIPIITTVLTTIVAFLPMLFIGGELGDLMIDLPKVAIAALTISVLEAFIILPSHLSGHKDSSSTPSSKTMYRTKSKVLNTTILYSAQLKELMKQANNKEKPSKIKEFFGKISNERHHFLEFILPQGLGFLLKIVLSWRYVALAIALGFILVVVGLVQGGVIPIVVMQEMDTDSLSLEVEMSPGTRGEQTLVVAQEILEILNSSKEVKLFITYLGSYISASNIVVDSHTIGNIRVELITAKERQEQNLKTSAELINELYQKIGKIPGIKKLTIEALTGLPESNNLDILIKGKDLSSLERTMGELFPKLKKYDGISNIKHNLIRGKRQVNFRLKESVSALGITTNDLANQLRFALYGFEAQKLQIGEEEVRVMVLLPKEEQQTLEDLSRLRIVTPLGGRVPLEEVAEYDFSGGYGVLLREDRKLLAKIEIRINEEKVNARELVDKISMDMDEVQKKYPGVTIELGGGYKENADSAYSLILGFGLVLFLIYAIIAVLFKSYLQPLLIMAAIPWAATGAILGHIIMGYPITFISIIGIVGLAGIVVNDTLVLASAVNKLQSPELKTIDILVKASQSRLRAILLTTITTTLGLTPLMFGQGTQAQTLIPIAVSLVFGLIIATLFTLFLLPVFYMILRDFKNLFNLTRIKYLKQIQR